VDFFKFAYFFSDLAVENWYDLLAFLSRPKLAQFSLRVGNRRFASILQTFLHKYVRQITLRPINLTETRNRHETIRRARVNLWAIYNNWGYDEYTVADWPMPENIINFESIQLRFTYIIIALKM
jgi:hypothetical protein